MGRLGGFSTGEMEKNSSEMEKNILSRCKMVPLPSELKTLPTNKSQYSYLQTRLQGWTFFKVSGAMARFSLNLSL